jgi:hypothetical protein
MSVEQAKDYIRRLRREVPLRQQFELVWQGKRDNLDDMFRDRGEPIVPRLLPGTAPDNKIDPVGYHRWWRIHRMQQDMHDLLFSKGDGRDHAQDYLDGEMITDSRIVEVINQPEMGQALNLLARIATACTGDDISLEDMNVAWHHYVRWIYKMTEYAGTNAEVRRLRRDAARDETLCKSVNDIASSKSMSLGAAHAVQGFLESGFAHDEAYEALERQQRWLDCVAGRAKEAGYDFTALDYLKDCIFKQWEDDPGPELDDRYWPKDDPNRWNYTPPPVRFTL